MKWLDRLRFRWYLRSAAFYYRQYNLYVNMDAFLSSKKPPYSPMLTALAGQVSYNVVKYGKKLDKALERCERIAGCEK